MVTVSAPATSANLGSGFDVFGLALSRPVDIVRVRRAEAVTIDVTGVGSQYIPEDPDRNTVGAVARALDAPAHIEVDKGVRPASGMGSSAASAAAAAVALNRLYNRGYTRAELVSVAAEGERVVSGDAHADNVAPALLGGFTIATGDGVTAVETGLSLVVCLPDIVVSTSDAREVVPDGATLDQLVETVGNAATLVAGICRSDPDLVGAGMSDPVVTPARAALVDGYDEVCSAARTAGATGVSISGAGPAVIAVCRSADRRDIASAMVDSFEDRGVDARAYQTRVGDGARVASR